MRISDWSSDVCSSDLTAVATADLPTGAMTLGLRPECIRPAALDGAPLAASVQVVERLGERTLLHVVLDDGTPIVAEDGGLSAMRTGDRLGLAVTPHPAHLFHSDRSCHIPLRLHHERR